MNSTIAFIELENRVVTATYRNLMNGAKVVLVDMATGSRLPDPIVTIASPVPGLAASSKASLTGAPRVTKQPGRQAQIAGQQGV